MKRTSLFVIALALSLFAFASCGTTKSAAFAKMYEEDPLVMLITAPFNNVAVETPSGHKTMCGFHWVTITEMDGDTLWVSSWGWKCKMSIKELRQFNVMLHFYSISLENQSNIV